MMSDFIRSIENIKKNINKMNKSIDLIKSFYSVGDLYKTNEELFNLVKISENSTERVRMLPIFTGYNKAKETVENIIIDELNINIKDNRSNKDDKELIHIHLNALLPKKEKERAGYIRASLITACERYYKEHSFDIITEPVVIVFKHNYNSTERMWRDHDNIEINVVMDAVALYFLSDDTSKSCDHFYFSDYTGEDSTDIFIIKQENFYSWLKENYRKQEG